TVTLIPNGIHHPPIEDGRLLPNSVKFGVGGTDENYTDYWNTASAYARANPETKESDDKDD
ncbi:hypothetical protein LC952_11505, partial [Enterococcus faecium]|nr:hypothetical protein [Enterococcus faecium]MCH3426299.1 hypothetical protein [Enterococcus faecium]